MTPEERPLDRFRLPETATSHPSNPIPEEPTVNKEIAVTPSLGNHRARRPQESPPSSESSSDSESPSTPATEVHVEQAIDTLKDEGTVAINFNGAKQLRHAGESTQGDADDVMHLGIGDTATTERFEKACCGGGGCFLQGIESETSRDLQSDVVIPDNDAFRSLHLKLGPLSSNSGLTDVLDVPPESVSLSPGTFRMPEPGSITSSHPPPFVTPHPPYEVFSARIHHARELTKPGAEKRTYHFEFDVTDYPDEVENVDFVVGGAIGVCAPNSPVVVDELLDRLEVPAAVRDQLADLQTTGGRWPTIWGEEEPRRLLTTRKELLTWCSDLQSHSPTKAFLRLLGEYASDESEKRILTYLTSAQGQAAFCE